MKHGQNHSSSFYFHTLWFNMLCQCQQIKAVDYWRQLVLITYGWVGPLSFL